MIQKNPKAKEYNTIKNRLALLEPLVLLVIFIAIQASGASAYFKEISNKTFSSVYASTALYALFFGVLAYLGMFLLGFYRNYLLEHKFGLSNQTLTHWLKDEAKKTIIAFILFLIFVELLYAALRGSPDMWWLYLAVIWIAISIAITKIAPVIIIPLFFKFEPLDDLELKKRLMELAGNFNINILDVFKLKMSAKTKKANAALVGLGKTRRVLLGDSLLENYTKDEISVVLAHELAHHKLFHIFKLTVFSGLSTILVFYLIDLTSTAITGLIGLGSISDITAFPSIMFSISLFSMLIAPIQNAFSRRLEVSADLSALEVTRLPKAFISCMKRLADQNLSDPSPGRLIEIMLYDHPPISKRIKMAEDFCAP